MNALRIIVDTERGVAPWRQVHDQIVQAIATGTLLPDSRLPTIRQLARDLGLASGTIARVYRELEAAGWVHTGRTKGTMVAHAAPAERVSPLHRAATEFAHRANELGADIDTAIAAVRSVYQQTSPSSAGPANVEPR